MGTFAISPNTGAISFYHPVSQDGECSGEGVNEPGTRQAGEHTEFSIGMFRLI